jgi:flagellar biosynthesis/type III secretory pathway ATPase
MEPYTVLVEGDDITEPVADETRSILDGHIILSRKLASANHYPAIAWPSTAMTRSGTFCVNRRTSTPTLATC